MYISLFMRFITEVACSKAYGATKQAHGPAVFRLEEHIARLFASAEVYGIEIPYTSDQLAEATCKLEVDGNLIGNSVPGPVTSKIQSIFFEAVAGRNGTYRDWLTPVLTGEVAV